MRWVIIISRFYIDRDKESSHDYNIKEDQNRATNKYKIKSPALWEGRTNPLLSLSFFHNILHTHFPLPKPFINPFAVVPNSLNCITVKWSPLIPLLPFFLSYLRIIGVSQIVFSYLVYDGWVRFIYFSILIFSVITIFFKLGDVTQFWSFLLSPYEKCSGNSLQKLLSVLLKISIFFLAFASIMLWLCFPSEFWGPCLSSFQFSGFQESKIWCPKFNRDHVIEKIGRINSVYFFGDKEKIA